ncbi:UNVERIFIED_CONTAM: hypothetical protein HDU68_010575 [Siphonaria sp. JEL0065]|nr:hypothetical protein HDU68_010575 [Siphonaria sp. JEL0065]
MPPKRKKDSDTKSTTKKSKTIAPVQKSDGTPLLCLLRGINVSGSKPLKMAELTQTFVDEGFLNPRTYIQSGNVVFSLPDDHKVALTDLEKHLASVIEEGWGYDVPVRVRSLAEMETVVSENPYLAFPGADTKHLHVTFLEGNGTAIAKNTLAADALLDTESFDIAKDTYIFSKNGREIYIYTPGGYGKTKLNNTKMTKRKDSNTTEPPTETVIYIGNIVHSLSLGVLEVLEGGAVAVDEAGRIVCVAQSASEPLRQFPGARTFDVGARLIIPGFVDAHCHAPQYSFVGTGMELPLLDWLNKYTFPCEERFKDPVYARKHYKTAVSRFLTNGTTTASYFATIHLESTKALVDVVQQVGQRGIIGKVNMDRNSPDFLIETTNQSIKDTQDFVNHVLAKRDPLVQPVITPRFVPSTSAKLMNALAQISADHDPKIRIQSHLSENKNEIKWVGEMHPDCASYSEVYSSHGLLHDRSYMAHCIWCNEGERHLLREKQVGIVHCPNSNFSLSSGALNVRRMLDEGMKVGLGSDVAGGYSPSMLDAIRQAITASKMVSIGQGSDADELSSPTGGGFSAPVKQYEALSYAEAFHLATVGGAECLSLGNVVGNFLVGKEFDALIVNPTVEGSPVDVFEGDTTLEIFQRFLFLGDDRNIEKVFVKGKNRKTVKLVES